MLIPFSLNRNAREHQMLPEYFTPFWFPRKVKLGHLYIEKRTKVIVKMQFFIGRIADDMLANALL